ncbi:succinyl-diaminopimelate desuccinylase [Faunimonas pinastri]|uniref:Succinyl-diaminopimelate desuccinylase n=1 Tax=Faunimonas pinastri TaxID=1855383 RepID=A0A1H9M1D0_9HYPH|nr:M20/M25/M40 family metallo-hydrolase [Faunimonas pinastri]SER17275.1 succinyl-diaminopimelate desuccinylase [Faunimonas pinastri]
MPAALSAAFDKALALIAHDDAAVEAELGRMLAVDTSYPPGENYGSFADLIQAATAPAGFEHRRVVVPEELWRAPGARGERVNLIATRRTGKPVCSLYFHTDTVPPGEGWSVPPLGLTRDGDRLTGRGAADMKGTVAAALAAIRAADAAGLELAYDPALLLCTDEEGGAYPGIRYLAEQGLVEGHLLSFNGGAAPRIWAGCFGSIDLLIRVRGRGGHSGDPGNGVNALEAALPLLNALNALKPAVAARASAMPAPPHYGERPLHGLLTVAAVHAGQKGSSLPAVAEILVNRRYAPEERFEDVLAELQDVIDRAMETSPALGYDMETTGHLIPVEDPSGPHWPRWQAALAKGFGFTEFRPWGSSTSSDMGFVQRTGLREILLGGLTRPDNNTHAPDEFTTLTDVKALATSILAYLAADFAPDLMPTAQDGAQQ